jgi:hypothetical protein
MKVEDTTRQEFDYSNAMPRNLFKALADFQQEVPVIHKGTTGYGYTYADLPAIFEAINPLMKKHGLGFTQLMQGTSLETRIFHVESGEYLQSFADIPQDVQLKGMNNFQVAGSAITYFRRYALSSALGLVTDKDTDAGGEKVSKNEAKTPVKRTDEEIMLPPLAEESFKKATEAVEKGTVTVSQIKAKYVLTTAQEKALELMQGIKK